MADVDPAVRRAREVVGLYGDPLVSWSIGSELEYASPVDVSSAGPRLEDLVRRHPHLGRPPRVQVRSAAVWEQAREELLSAPFGDHDPLVRLMVSEDRKRLSVVAHHGACDGFGMLAVAGVVSGVPLESLARGIGDRRSSRGFVPSSAGRVLEALVSPPARFLGRPAPAAEGERWLVRRLEPTKVGTAGLTAAVAAEFADQRRQGATRGRRPLVVFGASRRLPGVPDPDRQTAYFRFPFRPEWSVDRLRAVMSVLEPEPDFPETSARGIGPWVTRALRNRLGSTAILANLGVVRGGGVRSVAVTPAPSGPHAVALGLASTDAATTVSLRTRRAEFGDTDAENLLDGIVGRLG